MNVRRLLPYAGFAFLVAIIPALLASGDPTPGSPEEGSTLQRDDTNSIWRYKWWSQATHTYFVQTSEDLQTWTWAPIVEGGEGVREYGFTTTADKLFVRLRYINVAFADPETGDIDGDGITNLQEVQYGLNPFSNTDDNGNGIPDDWEAFHSNKFMAYPSALFSSLLWNQTSQEEIVLHNDTDSAVNYTIEITGNEGGGYSYDDSQNGSVVYTWEDISTTGIRLATVSENDNAFEAVVLTQFVFPFYDVDYSTVYVSSNGMITFGQGSSTHSSLGSSLPIPTEPAMLAVFWDDLKPHQLDDYNGLPGDIYYKEEADRLIVQWENVAQASDAGLTPTTFQAVLYADGIVEYRYNTIEGIADQATVGIQDALGATGIDFADNGIYIDSEMTVRIVPGGDFFTIDESLTGTVPAKSDATVQGTFNAKQLPFGEYTATVSISHDGTGSSPQIVSATLSIPLVYITLPEGDITILEGTGGVTFNASVQGEVDRVDYYYGSTLLGGSNGPPNYRFVWAFPYTFNDPPPGVHMVTAKAYATDGAVEDSLPVMVTVTPDTDLDGIPDEWEITHGFDPNDPTDATQDPDNDGFLNREEYERDLDPYVSLDTDGDGIPDGWEIQPAPYAFRFYPDNDYGAFPLSSFDPDTNDEGMLDGQKDYDMDSLTIVQEIALGTNPNRTDTDGDGLHDGLEVSRGSNPTVSENWVSMDTDGDGLNDLLEILFGTNPDDADSNNNGMNDREEIDNGGDAINPGPAPDPLPQSSTPAPPTPAPSPPDSITPGDYDILVEFVGASDAKRGFPTYEPLDPSKVYLTKKQVQTFMPNDPGCVESGPIGAAGSRTHEMDPDTGIIMTTGDNIGYIGDAPDGENGESVSPTRKSQGTDGMAYNDPPNLAPDCGAEWLYSETLSNEYTTEMVIANVESDLGDFTNDFEVGTPFAFRHLTDGSYAYQKVQFKFEWKEDVEEEQRFPITHLLVFYPEDDPNTPENETLDDAEVIRTISWDGTTEESAVFEVDPDTEKPETNGSYSLLTLKLEWEKFGDNVDLEENKNPITGEWMPGEGKRIFPGKKDPADQSPDRNKLKLKITGGLPDSTVYLKAFDVDDATPASLDIADVIDTNETAGADNLGSPQSGTLSQTSITLDSQGEGEVEFTVTMHPGDNFRVLAALKEEDLNLPQVEFAGSIGYVPPNDNHPALFKGFSSSMLTVWRKLHIENDSMMLPNTMLSPDRQVANGLAWGTVTMGLTSRTTLTIDLPESVPARFYDAGKIKRQGIEHNIHYINSHSAGSTITVLLTRLLTEDEKSNFGVGELEIFDDDDVVLPDGWTSSLPRLDLINNNVKSKFIPAYILLTDAPTVYTTDDVPFVLNTPTSIITGFPYIPDEVRLRANLPTTNDFWGFTVTTTYQDAVNEDSDPSSDIGAYGATDSDLSIALIYIQTIIERHTNFVAVPKTILSSLVQKLLDETVAHEIGHGPTTGTEDEDHEEGGLMNPLFLESESVNEFKPKSIKRFRGTESWKP